MRGSGTPSTRPAAQVLSACLFEQAQTLTQTGVLTLVRLEKSLSYNSDIFRLDFSVFVYEAPFSPLKRHSRRLGAIPAV
jgi:hypothetical protein